MDDGAMTATSHDPRGQDTQRTPREQAQHEGFVLVASLAVDDRLHADRQVGQQLKQSAVLPE